MTWRLDVGEGSSWGRLVISVDGLVVAEVVNHQVGTAIVVGLNLLEEAGGSPEWWCRVAQWQSSVNAHNPPDDSGERKA